MIASTILNDIRDSLPLIPRVEGGAVIFLLPSEGVPVVGHIQTWAVGHGLVPVPESWVPISTSYIDPGHPSVVQMRAHFELAMGLRTILVRGDHIAWKTGRYPKEVSV